ncbi:helix-turn-helix domain-containing protein [Streptococcus thermophilus]|uniref:helix-turn-helix domain-containing protein n=1 Tax=Streptococcus thermophilus TaxID=1308 RepID=UPI001C647CAD|nr:RstR family transcriptional repressor [Streptococcus thermophilus]MBW7823408.1 helix-turn-helix domain-containing protein [Streptococcus thermophilus]
MDFAERLKTLRKQANFTQKEIAEKIGISQPAYGDWERGTKKPTQENLVKLAKIFNVSVDNLLDNTIEEDELANVEVLFRMASDGLTDEEKATFREELIDFMKERKKAFEEDKNN